MADVTDVQHAASDIPVTVRFFAAARDAAGVDETEIRLPEGATLADLTAVLAVREGPLGQVLRKCSYLRDGFAVRDPAIELRSGQTIDVLPPFAGG